VFKCRDLIRNGNRREDAAGAKPGSSIKLGSSGCRSEVPLKKSLFPLLLLILSSGISTVAQDTGPRAILVDQIGGRVATFRKPVKAGTPVRSASSADAVERRVFQLMNAERQAFGLKLLEWDESLLAVARMHSRNMADEKFFSHKGRDGAMVHDRAAQFGIVKWFGIGENIATMRGYDDPAATAVESWMRSNSHKKNILNGQWQETAIGSAVADDGTIYFTQVFIVR